MALIPKEYLKSVFSIEIFKKWKYKSIWTGFIYFKRREKIESGESWLWDHYLVTAKHVIYNEKKEIAEQIQEIFLRFDTLWGKNTRTLKLQLYKDQKSVFQTTVTSRDIAIMRINSNSLIQENIDFIQIFDESALFQKDYEEKGLSIWDEVFFLGFPLGLRGVTSNYALCRHWIIARLDNETLKKNIIYLDAPVFPGNSWWPVFVKPQSTHIQGTKAIDRAYLLWIATSYIYPDEEIDSTISKKDLKKMEGHLGLAKIITVDSIEKAIEDNADNI
jgi:S1-C subfamily serine protease